MWKSTKSVFSRSEVRSRNNVSMLTQVYYGKLVSLYTLYNKQHTDPFGIHNRKHRGRFSRWLRRLKSSSWQNSNKKSSVNIPGEDQILQRTEKSSCKINEIRIFLIKSSSELTQQLTAFKNNKNRISAFPGNSFLNIKQRC